VGPSAMRVRVKINQADLGQMRVGAAAKVTLDAYPGKSYPARLRQVSPIGVAGQFSPKVRTFVALFDVEGVDPQLAPDLSAAVDVDVMHGTQ
jgi:HlyD family secretion protein